MKFITVVQYKLLMLDPYAVMKIRNRQKGSDPTESGSPRLPIVTNQTIYHVRVRRKSSSNQKRTWPKLIWKTVHHTLSHLMSLAFTPTCKYENLDKKYSGLEYRCLRNSRFPRIFGEQVSRSGNFPVILRNDASCHFSGLLGNCPSRVPATLISETLLVLFFWDSVFVISLCLSYLSVYLDFITQLI